MSSLLSNVFVALTGFDPTVHGVHGLDIAINGLEILLPDTTMAGENVIV